MLRPDRIFQMFMATSHHAYYSLRAAIADEDFSLHSFCHIEGSVMSGKFHFFRREKKRLTAVSSRLFEYQA